jgi:hypothetical protein
MKIRRQSSTSASGVPFTRSIDDRRRLMAANDPARGSGLHPVIVASIAAVLLIVALSLLLR